MILFMRYSEFRSLNLGYRKIYEPEIAITLYNRDDCVQDAERDEGTFANFIGKTSESGHIADNGSHESCDS